MIEPLDVATCNILLTPHPNATRMWGRLTTGGRAKLIDGRACRRYAEFARQQLGARLKQDRAADL
ncbi:MAG: hypothetical protein R3E77_10375 [Steroidobacteraceae bacterium]